MEINVEELLNKVSEQVKSFAKTDLVIGEEFQMGEFTCKPVIKIGTGFGSGVGTGNNQVRGSKRGEGGGRGSSDRGAGGNRGKSNRGAGGNRGK